MQHSRSILLRQYVLDCTSGSTIKHSGYLLTLRDRNIDVMGTFKRGGLPTKASGVVRSSPKRRTRSIRVICSTRSNGAFIACAEALGSLDIQQTLTYRSVVRMIWNQLQRMFHLTPMSMGIRTCITPDYLASVAVLCMHQLVSWILRFAHYSFYNARFDQYFRLKVLDKIFVFFICQLPTTVKYNILMPLHFGHAFE